MNPHQLPAGRPPLPDQLREKRYIQLRASIARKNAYIDAAIDGNYKSLTEFIFAQCDKAAGYTEEEYIPNEKWS